MPYNADPATWITGWNVASNNLQLPLAQFPKLSSAEATPGTANADVRRCWFALLDKLFTTFVAKQAAGDAPTKMTVTKNSLVNTSTNRTTTTYNVSFVTEFTDEEVVSE
jgi:hypothetical protein